jgi:glycosyltransferase involved in cell wall biosynthesis
MEKDFTISLIIPAHNEEKYLGACLEHALKNSGGKFLEIIVVDNASTDSTAKIAGNYPGVRIVYEKNKGLTYARQRGFLEARGDILAYIDADTRMPEGYYERIEKEFGKNPRLASFSGPHDYYDVKKSYRILNKIYWRILAFPFYIIIGYMTAGVNFAIRRDVLQKINGFDTSIAFYGEDTNIARRTHKHGKVKFSPSFSMPTSGRRLTEHGIFKIGGIYVMNFVSEVVWHKPLTREYKDIR